MIQQSQYFSDLYIVENVKTSLCEKFSQAVWMEIRSKNYFLVPVEVVVVQANDVR